MKIEIYNTSGCRKVLIDGNPVEDRLLSVDFNLKGWDDPIVNLCFLPDELIVDADDCKIIKNKAGEGA